MRIPRCTNAKALPAERPIMRAMPNQAQLSTQVQLVPAQALGISLSIAYAYKPFSSLGHPKAFALREVNEEPLPVIEGQGVTG
jgi:hypothetical protein